MHIQPILVLENGAIPDWGATSPTPKLRPPALVVPWDHDLSTLSLILHTYRRARGLARTAN
jgi:hypothetical protein